MNSSSLAAVLSFVSLADCPCLAITLLATRQRGAQYRGGFSSPISYLFLSLSPISLSVTFCKANVDHLRTLLWGAAAWHGTCLHTLCECVRESEIRAFRLFALSANQSKKWIFHSAQGNAFKSCVVSFAVSHILKMPSGNLIISINPFSKLCRNTTCLDDGNTRPLLCRCLAWLALVNTHLR